MQKRTDAALYAIALLCCALSMLCKAAPSVVLLDPEMVLQEEDKFCRRQSHCEPERLQQRLAEVTFHAPSCE